MGAVVLEGRVPDTIKHTQRCERTGTTIATRLLYKKDSETRSLIISSGSSQTREMDGFLVIFTLLAYSTIPAESTLTQSFHSSLTQAATVGCALADNLTLSFFLDEGTDFVGAIYLVNQTDPTDNTESTFSLTSGDITGTGTTADPRTFSVMALTNGTNFITSLAPNSQGMKAEITGGEVLSVQVMVKSNSTLSPSPFMENVIFPDDVLYTASCNVSELRDILVNTGNIAANGTIDEIPTQLTETVDMIISTSADPVPANSVNVGDSITLMLRHVNNGSSYATGFYAHTCSVCDTALCDGPIKLDFVNPKGCAVTDYITQFKTTKGNDLLETNAFLAFILRDQNFMFYRCYVNFCYTPGDLQCSDLCAYKTSQGSRRKRDVVEKQVEDIAVSTYLRVTIDANDEVFVEQMDPIKTPGLYGKQPAIAEKQKDVERTVLLGTVVSLAALLLIGLAVAILIFYRLSGKAKPKQIRQEFIFGREIEHKWNTKS